MVISLNKQRSNVRYYSRAVLVKDRDNRVALSSAMAPLELENIKHSQTAPSTPQNKIVHASQPYTGYQKFVNDLKGNAFIYFHS